MVRFISKPADGRGDFSTPIHVAATGPELIAHGLWGDRVFELGERSKGRVHARVRGRVGWVDEGRLCDTALLELYVIDVGNGDGMLLVTPDGRHILIDGGWPRRKQPTHKSAADFVDWKFAKEYGKDYIALDAMICTHNDADHYGGLWDLLDPRQDNELDIPTKRVDVEMFHHAGLSWWKEGEKQRSLGPVMPTEHGQMYVRLLNDRASAEEALDGQPSLQGDWAKFIRRVVATRTKHGEPTPVFRLSNAAAHLPGFGPGESAAVIHVLGPVEFEVDGKPAIRNFGGRDDKNTNGNSVLLRVDYGHARILLTGDLNKASQRQLLSDHEDSGVFAADVAKCCHHGSADVSLEFLRAINPTVTVISSGDSEGHDHPRPNIIAASAITGFQTVRDDELVTPLIYCTELARSVGIGLPHRVDVTNADGTKEEIFSEGFRRVDVEYSKADAGDMNPSKRTRSFAGLNVVAGLVYGLINVRTDGETIICAALNEKDGSWNVHTIDARF